MTTRKIQRRRSAFRELLQNLEIRPFSEDAPEASGGWLKQPRPRLAYVPRPISARTLDRR